MYRLCPATDCGGDLGLTPIFARYGLDTRPLAIGASLSTGASIAAEVINSRTQKLGL